MQCFVHDGAGAVGVCRNCGRGLCHGCAAETTGGLACSGRCEQAVAQTAELVRRNVFAGRGDGVIQLFLAGGSGTVAVYLLYAAVNGGLRGSMAGVVLYGGLGLFNLALAAIFGRAFVAVRRTKAR